MTTLEKLDGLTGSGSRVPTGASRRTGGASWKRGLGRIALSAAVAGALCLMAGVASAKVIPCPATITSCGCTINKAGYYVVPEKTPLFASDGLTDKGGCIDINTSNAVLNLNGNDIEGPENPCGDESTVGIHILKGANNNFVEGFGAVIEFWGIGVGVEGNGNIVEDFDSDDNSTDGVGLKNASNNNINDFSAGDNCGDGVVLKKNSNNNQINCSNADDNGDSGVFLASGKNNRVYDHGADDNAVFGIGIASGSTNNIVTDNSATGNGSEDLDDGNANCDNNLWFFNSFGTSNPGSCINIF